MKIARSKNGIFLSQRKYTLDLLKEIGMLGCEPTDTLINVNHGLGLSQRATVDIGRYQMLVRKLIYLTHT